MTWTDTPVQDCGGGYFSTQRTRTLLSRVDPDAWPDLLVVDDAHVLRVYHGTGTGFDEVGTELAPPIDGEMTEVAIEARCSVDLDAAVVRGSDDQPDSVVRLLDLDEDGWLDVYDGAAHTVRWHSAVGGGGWSEVAEAVVGPWSVGGDFEAVRIVRLHHEGTRLIATRPVVDLLDVTGDGLADVVDARSWSVEWPYWDVYPGIKGGWATSAVAFEAPSPWLEDIDEGSAAGLTFYLHENVCPCGTLGFGGLEVLDMLPLGWIEAEEMDTDPPPTGGGGSATVPCNPMGTLVEVSACTDWTAPISSLSAVGPLYDIMDAWAPGVINDYPDVCACLLDGSPSAVVSTLRDVNGDGLMDFVEAGVVWYRNLGTRFEVEELRSLPSAWPASIEGGQVASQLGTVETIAARRPPATSTKLTLR